MVVLGPKVFGKGVAGCFLALKHFMVEIAETGARNPGANPRIPGANPHIPGAIIISVPRRPTKPQLCAVKVPIHSKVAELVQTGLLLYTQEHFCMVCVKSIY